VRGPKVIGLVLFDRVILQLFLLEVFHELLLEVSLFALIADSFEIIFNLLLLKFLPPLNILRVGILGGLFEVNFMFDVQGIVAGEVLIMEFLHVSILDFTCFY
jgi:hypothetical protein